jgi:aspartate racemase
VAAGATLVLMPCNTAHLWFDEIRDALQVPMLHLVDAALEDVANLAGEHDRVGLLATDATLASGLYMNRRAGPHGPVRWLLPTAREMSDHIMPGIEAVKAGRLGDGSALLSAAAQALVRRGASALVMGCTEIPLVLDAERAGCPLIDATAALARRAVAWSISQRSAATGMGAAGCAA